MSVTDSREKKPGSTKFRWLLLFSFVGSFAITALANPHPIRFGAVDPDDLIYLSEGVDDIAASLDSDITTVSNMVVVVTNGLASTNWVLEQKYVTKAVTNELSDRIFDADGYVMTNLVRTSSLLDEAVTKEKIDGSVTNWLATTNWVTDIVSKATPGNYNEVSNRAMNSVQVEIDPAFTNWVATTNYVWYSGDHGEELLFDRDGNELFDFNAHKDVVVYGSDPDPGLFYNGTNILELEKVPAFEPVEGSAAYVISNKLDGSVTRLDDLAKIDIEMDPIDPISYFVVSNATQSFHPVIWGYLDGYPAVSYIGSIDYLEYPVRGVISPSQSSQDDFSISYGHYVMNPVGWYMDNGNTWFYTVTNRTYNAYCMNKMLEGDKTNSFDNIWFDVRNGKGRFSFEQDGCFWSELHDDQIGYDGDCLYSRTHYSMLHFRTNGVLKAGTVATVEDLAGYITSEAEFDAWKTGSSIAAGNGATANSTFSVGIGNRARAAGNKSIAISAGDNSDTTNSGGESSVAIGTFAKSSATGSIAIGKRAGVDPSGTNSIQLGGSTLGNLSTPNTFRYRDTVIVNQDGKIPSANLDKAFVDKTGDTMTGGLTVPNLTVGSRASGSTIGENSVAEGDWTTASGYASHAEGDGTTASGYTSHAEGNVTTASGGYSHSEGEHTTAQNLGEHAQGRYNKSNKANATFGNAGNTIHSIGIGSGDSDRKNAVEVMQDGKVFVKGVGGYDGTNPATATNLATVVNGLASTTWVESSLANHTHSNLVNGATEVIANADGTASISTAQIVQKPNCVRVLRADGSTGKTIVLSFRQTSDELESWWSSWPDQLEFTIEYDGVSYDATTVGESDPDDCREVSTSLSWANGSRICPAGVFSPTYWDGVLRDFESPGGLDIVGDGNGESCSTYTYTSSARTSTLIATVPFVDDHKWNWVTQVTNAPAIPTYQDVTNAVRSITNLSDRIVSGSNEAYVNSSGAYYKHPDGFGLPATLSFNSDTEYVKIGSEMFPSNYTVVINPPEVTSSATPPVEIYGLSTDGKWYLLTEAGDTSTGWINYVEGTSASHVFRITGFTGNNFSIVLDPVVDVPVDPRATLTRSTAFAIDKLATQSFVHQLDGSNAKPEIIYDENPFLHISWGTGSYQDAYLPYYGNPSEFPKIPEGVITTNGNGSVNVYRLDENSVSGNDNFVFGNNNSVSGNNVTVFGNGNLVTNSNYAVTIGQIHTVKNSDNSIASGGSPNNLEDSPNSIITGVGGTTAMNSGSSFVLSGGGGGVYNSPNATFLSPTGTSVYDSQNIIIGGYHHNVVSNAPYSVVLGGLTAVTNQYVFMWNGGYGQYVDHGQRTFNVNPLGGLSGFWIGDKNLKTYLGSIDNVLYKSTTLEGSESEFQSLKYYDLLDTFVGSRRANRYVSLYGALYVGEKADLVSTAFDPNPGGFTLSVGRGNTEAKGRSSVALGNNVTTADDDSFVTGYGGKVTGKIGFASGKNTRAKGNVSTATGEGTTAAGYASSSSGWFTLASAGTSQAHGKYVSAKDSDSWAWSAGFDSTSAPRASLWTAQHADNIQSLTNGFYESHGPGTFNVDPIGGTEGFWIGETNLATYLAGGGGPITEYDPNWTDFKSEANINMHTNGNARYVSTTVGLNVSDVGTGSAVQSSLAVGDSDVYSFMSLGAGYGIISNATFGVGLGAHYRVTNSASFVWTGAGYEEDFGYSYGSHGVGTFNVDPVGGTEGFWIGETNLTAHLNNSTKLALDSIAPAFSASNVYTNGDYVVYDLHLYECTNYTGQAGWRAGDWKQTTVTEILGDISRLLDEVLGGTN